MRLSRRRFDPSLCEYDHDTFPAVSPSSPSPEVVSPRLETHGRDQWFIFAPGRLETSRHELSRETVN